MLPSWFCTGKLHLWSFGSTEMFRSALLELSPRIRKETMDSSCTKRILCIAWLQGRKCQLDSALKQKSLRGLIYDPHESDLSVSGVA